MTNKGNQINRTDNFGELSDTVSIPNKEKTISVSKFKDIKLTIPCKKEIEEEQIEKMANCKLCYQGLGGCGVKNREYCSEWKQAVRQYEQGYRKLPKHSVVLSGEQCVEIVQDNYNIGYERGSKETAEKILKFLDEYSDCDSAYLAEQAEEFIIKQLGVKIKE